jgi:hypothetical protein
MPSLSIFPPTDTEGRERERLALIVQLIGVRPDAIRY